MKNLFLVLAFFAGITLAKAQDVNFGFTAGYLNTQEKVNTSEGDVSENYSGFYVGAFADFAATDLLHIKPGVNYGNVEDTNLLFIPVLAQFYIADSGFNFQLGPQASIILEEKMEGIKNFGLDITGGIGYDINEHFFIEGRYALEVTNRLDSEVRDMVDGDAKYHINNFFVGVGYKL